MKSIERRFKKIKEKNIYWSNSTCFAVAITGQNFSRRTIAKWFDKLVDKNDYDKNNKKAIRAFHESLTKELEEGIKLTRVAPVRNYYGRVDSLVIEQSRSS